ncbi:MAG: hypothetical protein ACYDA1_11000, partial [Vulcanimicrobiaceae bacterium]
LDDMTTTQQLTMSVLTAPLAQIDRRTLSQAWYSALQLARPHHASAASLDATPRKFDANAMHLDRADCDAGHSHRSLPASRTSHTGHAVYGSPSQDRRAARSSLARRIERQFLHPMKRPTSATVRFADGSRCRVNLLQRDGLVHLIVVAPARHANVLRQALDQTRFALARSGVRIACEVRESEANDVN